MPFDKFHNPYFYPSKSGGFNFEQSDNPKNDTPIEGLDSDFSVSGNVITMKCNGATSFSIGKNGRSFSDSIGGCKMDFKATAKRGYAYKADDVRDLEFKVHMRIPSNLSSGSDGFSMSSCTGHHSGNNCCQGFAYMGSLDGINSNPTKFRFRKETVHVEYTDSSEGTWSHPLVNFKLSGHTWFGFGFCRYNKPTSGGTSPQDDSVILEIWFNPDTEADATDWTMLKRTEDKKGRGWTGSKNACNGDSDQIGVWSGAHNRLKSNSTSGTIQFKNISFREINAFGSFDEPPPPPNPCPPGQHKGTSGNCEPDTVNCPPGQHQDSSGICVDDEPSTPPPAEPTKVKGFFTLKRDINIYRTDPCEGSTGGIPGGGGGGGSILSTIYDINPANDKELSDSSTFDHRTRLTQYVSGSASGLIGEIIKQIDVPLKKVGSPTASVYAKIWSSTGSVLYTSPTVLSSASLTTSFVDKTFDFSTNTRATQKGDRIGVQFATTSSSSYVVGGYDDNTIADSHMSQFEDGTTWDGKTDRDFAMVIWS